MVAVQAIRSEEFHSLLLIFLAPVSQSSSILDSVSQSSSILDSGPCHYHGSTERGPQQTKLHTQVATCNCGGRDIGKLSLYCPLIGQVLNSTSLGLVMGTIGTHVRTHRRVMSLDSIYFLDSADILHVRCDNCNKGVTK